MQRERVDPLLKRLTNAKLFLEADFKNIQPNSIRSEILLNMAMFECYSGSTLKRFTNEAKQKFSQSLFHYIKSYKHSDSALTNDEDTEMERASKVMKENLRSTIMKEKPNIKFSDIIGMDEAKKAIKTVVLYPMLFPLQFKGLKPWKGVLLYGVSFSP